MLLGIILISFAFVVDARIFNDASYKRVARTVCETADCRKFADAITQNMNSTVDPCTDFYEYACGNWPRQNPMPPGKHNLKFLMLADQANKRKVANMLKEPFNTDEISPVRIVKAWYQACIDTEGMEKRNMQPYEPILTKIGGWPMIMQKNEWDESRYPWQKVDDYYFALRGSNLLHEARVAEYGKDASGLSVVLDVPDLPPASWLLNSEVEEENANSTEESSEENSTTADNRMKKDGKYWEFVLKITRALAEAANQSIPQEKLDREIEELLSFQYKLGQLTYDVGDYVNMTLREFQQWYNDIGPLTKNSKVNWTEKIINVFKAADVDIDEHTSMKVAAPEYFRNVIPLLDATPTRTIVNYLHWNFVSSSIAKTTDEMRKLFEKTTGDGEEDPDQPSRSEQCIEEAQMNDIIAYEYIRKYFSNETLGMATDALDDIQKEIELQIQASNWANKKVKQWALKKLRTIKRYIGYPNWYKNETAMNNYFSALSMGSAYFENSLTLQRYYTIKKLRALKHEDDVKPWLVDPLTINAFYLTEDNSITVPVANLQQPFFTSTQPNTVNYALTGFLLAHEMNHGYDAQRYIYDNHGNEINWPMDVVSKYNNSFQCFIQQTDNLTLDGKPNGPKIEGYGNQTLEEAMSDAMGVQAAFKAYQRRERINGKLEPVLLGLERFTNDQLFFLSFANLWCEEIDPEYLPILPKFDMHGTGRIRTISSLSNNPDFAQAFNCPLGSPMNPRKRCNTWIQYSSGKRTLAPPSDYRVQQV